jgi:hypothetical protein
MVLPYTRAEVKDRVRATWKGACNVTLPSFTTSFDALNAKAIEHDVRLGAKMGFWGTLIASECGTTFKEYLQFMEIAAGAAPKGFALVTHLSFDTVGQMIEAAHAAETLGFQGAGLAALVCRRTRPRSSPLQADRRCHGSCTDPVRRRRVGIPAARSFRPKAEQTGDPPATIKYEAVPGISCR